MLEQVSLEFMQASLSQGQKQEQARQHEQHLPLLQISQQLVLSLLQLWQVLYKELGSPVLIPY